MPTLRIPLPDDVAQAIRALVIYLADTEAQDFAASPPSAQSRHIHIAVTRVARWLETHAPSVPPPQQPRRRI